MSTEKTTNQARVNAKNAIQSLDRISENSRGIIDTVTLWIDLLGFRKHLDDKNWDLHTEEAQLGLKRIAAFHEVALLAMHEKHSVVHLNDAIVISKDFEDDNYEKKELTEFLSLIDFHFEIAALTDREVGGYGVRGVVASRKRYNLRANLGWVKDNNEQRNPDFLSPTPIMMNTAFGKAYAVELSKKLVKNSSLYVEKSLVYSFGAAIMETWNIDRIIDIPELGQYVEVRSEEF